MLAKPDLIENLGENALVHCITDSGKEFIVKTTDVALFEGKKEVALTTDAPLRHFSTAHHSNGPDNLPFC